MSAPSEIRNEILKQLRAARTAMRSSAFALSLRTLSEEERRLAAICRTNNHQMIIELENEKLAAIAEALKENEADIKISTDNMAMRLANLERAKQLIDGVAGALKVISKVIPLLIPI